MTDFQLIIDLHRLSERQGPGSPADTLRALTFMDLPTDRPLKVADIGCGTGGQTMVLARQIHGHLTAVDLFPEFLEELDNRSRAAGWQDRISTLRCSMDDLPFPEQSFDILWSEGAIYNMGFEHGVRAWKDFLKTGGYLAVSEATWITPDRPKEIERFWMNEYPEIDMAAARIRILEDHGFSLTGYFQLDPASWIDHYYQPLEAGFASFLERQGHSEAARRVVDEYQAEIDLYQKYQDYYSYGFYIARKCR
ncbi:MAG: methyltransferase domain-containing protein [Saprospiraceae bacterium]